MVYRLFTIIYMAHPAMFLCVSPMAITSITISCRISTSRKLCRLNNVRIRSRSSYALSGCFKSAAVIDTPRSDGLVTIITVQCQPMRSRLKIDLIFGLALYVVLDLADAERDVKKSVV